MKRTNGRQYTASYPIQRPDEFYQLIAGVMSWGDYVRFAGENQQSFDLDNAIDRKVVQELGLSPHLTHFDR